MLIEMSCCKVCICLILTVHLFQCLSAQYTHVIYVDPSKGNNSAECLNSAHPPPCKTLDWVFQQPQARLSSTHFLLTEGTHELTQPSLPFKDVVQLSFSGSDSVIECSGPETGLAFVNVSNLAFRRISFRYCEALRNSTSYDFYNRAVSTFRVGLYFYLCENLTMENVSVDNSPNATGVVIYDTDGKNTFTNCSFANNTFLNPYKEDSSLIDDSIYPGGGGVYVEFTYCEPGETCSSPQQEKNSHSNYTFQSCKFRHNVADNLDTQDRSTYIVPHGTDHEAFGRGGGLSVFLNGNANNIRIEVLDCLFDGNRALWGGGMFVELHDLVWGNNIIVEGTLFVNNWCPYTISEGTGGGGMRVGLYVFEQGAEHPSISTRNTVALVNCTFSNNSALHGGGLSVSPALQNVSSLEYVANVDLILVNFDQNTAKVGSALDLDRFGDILVGLMIRVNVSACIFRNNSIKYAQYIGKGDVPYELGLGALHIDAVPVELHSVLLEDNDGSGLAVTGTTIIFSGNENSFRRNQGFKGGAIALYGAATIQVRNDTVILFQDNSASTLGGAIYNAFIERENLKSDSNCFIHHSNVFLNPDDWPLNFTFINNWDQDGTHYNAIHSTSILPCSVPGGSGIINDTARIFCWRGWAYPDASRCEDAITSDIGSLTYLRGNRLNVYPGWRFDLPISIQDDLNNTLKDQSFSIKYNDTKEVTVTPKESVQVGGTPNDVVEISLESFGERVWHFDMYVTLMECPPGFVSTGNVTDYSQCTCADNQFGGAILCDDFSHTVYILNGKWMGKLKNDSSSKYVVMNCPLNFCNRENTRYRKFVYQHGLDYDYDNDDLSVEICGEENRNGINCATCAKGYGVTINSPNFECIPCRNISLGSNIAKYIAAVYLPLAFLFSILVVFDIRLTTGPANAFILYCQVVSSTFDLNADGGVPHSDKILEAYRFPFGIANLEFIEDYISPICFSEHFITLQVFILQYAVAVFPIFMILIVIGCLKISETCCLKNQRLSVQQRRVFLSISRLASLLSRNKRKNINDALLPAFASFLLLSYTKFSTISSYILNTQHPVDENGSQVEPARVYYASQYSVEDPAYESYKVTAIVVFITIVSFLPLILLDYPLKAVEWVIVRIKCLNRIYPVDKIHLFLNMFQGCYRVKMRFFAGLYFGFRFVINLSYVLADTWLQQFLVQQAATTIMIMLLAVFHPYEKKFLNYVDILIFTNLAILNSISFYLFSFVKIDPNLTPPTGVLDLQYVLVFLPLIYMLGYLLWNVTRRYHNWIRTKVKNFLKKLNRRDYQPINSDSDDDIPTIMGKPPPRSFVDRQREFEDDVEAMLYRAEDTNTYRAGSMSKSMSVVEITNRQGEGEAIVKTINSRTSFPTTPELPEDYDEDLYAS